MNEQTNQRQAAQREIAHTLEVAADFDADKEIERRVQFLANYLIAAKCRALVLGISGGVDSLVTGLLAQRAAESARAQGWSADFWAMRLPYGTQQDEHDAKACLDFIHPDHAVTVNIQAASDPMLAALEQAGLEFRDAAHRDFILGNIKARQRMIAQYAVAGAHNGLVVGTDHAAEALMGFFTKFGDGAADVTPLTGLTKRRVRALASALGAPQNLVHKVPTADLESLAPQKPDEAAFGITYDQIDDFLEGKDISQAAYDTIMRIYRNSAHKRAGPVSLPL